MVDNAKKSWRDTTNLESALKLACENDDEDFPFPVCDSKDYYTQYTNIAIWLIKNVHPYVAVGSASKDGGLLTRHDVGHIEQVIRRAGQLTSHNRQLKPYEIYLLLCAIQVHDAGNLFGRDDHETRCHEILNGMGPIAGGNTTEKRMIASIASAHGGDIGGNKDTIGILPAEPQGPLKVRYQHIAAILRLSDELADDRTRAARYANSSGAVPFASKVYHKFAEKLNEVDVMPEDGIVKMNFDLFKEDCTTQFGKDDKEVYLLDEIFVRTAKTHRERVYCNRFLTPDINIVKVLVKIDVYMEPSNPSPVKTIQYVMKEDGYPDHYKTLEQICGDQIKMESGELWTGAALSNFITQQGETNDSID